MSNTPQTLVAFDNFSGLSGVGCQRKCILEQRAKEEQHFRNACLRGVFEHSRKGSHKVDDHWGWRSYPKRLGNPSLGNFVKTTYSTAAAELRGSFKGLEHGLWPHDALKHRQMLPRAQTDAPKCTDRCSQVQVHKQQDVSPPWPASASSQPENATETLKWKRTWMQALGMLGLTPYHDARGCSGNPSPLDVVKNQDTEPTTHQHARRSPSNQEDPSRYYPAHPSHISI